MTGIEYGYGPERCQWCHTALDCNDPSYCDDCGMDGCHGCIRIYDDVMGYLCRACRPVPAVATAW